MTNADRPRRYFDNAATTFPKPPGVSEAMRDHLENIGVSPGRGAYREVIDSDRVMDDCRTAIRTLLGCDPEDQVIFTLNGTDALNMAIKGAVQPGDHVVTTVLDHNSVLRPLAALQDAGGVSWTAVPVDPQTTRLNPDVVVAAIRDNTSLVAVNHASNVTGTLQPLEAIVELCTERDIPLLVDGSQSAGHVPIDLSQLPIDMFACPGHKGLLGPLGTGVLVLRAEVAEWLRTSREGGTGSASESPLQPQFLPDKFEPGSPNAVGLAGLGAAVRWILERGLENLRQHELALSRRMIERLDAIPGLRCFGPSDVTQRVGVFSVRIDGLEPDDLSAVLEERFGILTRSGLHCAPLAHEAIGTHADGGTTRLSVGPFHDETDVDAAADALAEITSGVIQPARA